MNSESNTILYTLLGMTGLWFLYNHKSSDDVVEHFGMIPNMKLKMMQETKVPGQKGLYSVPIVTYRTPTIGSSNLPAAGLANNIYQGVAGMGERNISTGPSLEHTKYANLVFDQTTEGFCGGCSGGGVEGFTSAGCRQVNLDLGNPQPIVSGNNPSMKNYGNMGYQEASDLLPVRSMAETGGFANEYGEEQTQPIIYDRYIYANQKSVVNGQGDYIRGDIPIVPDNTGWFSSRYRDPNVDLRAGALAVMGGANNDTTKELLALKAASVGGLLSVGSGVNFATQKQINLSGSGGDIAVTSFP